MQLIQQKKGNRKKVRHVMIIRTPSNCNTNFYIYWRMYKIVLCDYKGQLFDLIKVIIIKIM